MVAIVLGLPVRDVRIFAPDAQDIESRHMYGCGTGGQVRYDMRSRARVRLWYFAIATAAGIVADPRAAVATRGDRKQLLELALQQYRGGAARTAEARRLWMRSARATLRAHASAWRRVAAALCKRDRLSAKELRALIERPRIW